MSVEPPVHPHAVLVIWSHRDPEISHFAREIAAELRTQVPPLIPIDADLHNLMGAAAAARSMAAWASRALETSMVSALAGQSMEAELRRARPELVLALDPTAAAVASTWRQKGQLPAPVVGVLPGLSTSSRWGEVDVQRVLVHDDDQASEVEGLGRRAEVVSLAGPAAFLAAAAEDGVELRRRFSVPLERPAVLVDTEGIELDELSEVLLQLALVGDKAAFLFDTGGDGAVSQHLRSRAELYGVSAQMFGMTPETPSLWALSDVLVARPLRTATRRALSARLTLCAVNPHDDEEGQEARAFSRREIGAVVERPFTLAVELERLLREEYLDKAAARFSRIASGEPLGAAVARLCSQATELLGEAARPPQSAAPLLDHGGMQKPAVDVDAGPLEVIGPASAAAGSGSTARAAEAEAALRRLAAEEELARLKERAGLPPEERSGERDPSAESAPTSAPDEAVLSGSSGIDPRIKKELGKREQAVEDALAEIKRRLKGE